MKYLKNIIYILVALCSLSAFSQKKEEIRDFFWGKSDKYKKIVPVPDKWKNESAVIVLKQQFYDYHKFAKNVTYTSAARKRIVLQDLAAVKEFSEFEFKDKFRTDKGIYASKASTKTIGVKVVKPDGKEIVINVDKEAKEVEGEKKIAIPHLEVGDIIDFYVYSVEPFVSDGSVRFDPVETTIGDVYPIMDFKLDFNAEKNFFINFNTYNGAPELKEFQGEKKGERKYQLVAKDIEKNEFPRWFLPLVELPCYKFQVFFAVSDKFEGRVDGFLSSDENVVKKTVNKEDIFNYFNDKFKPSGDIGHIKRFLKDKNFKSQEEKVREVYYFTRHKYFTQFIEPIVVNDSHLFYADYYYTNDNPIFLSSETAFINHFMEFLKDNKIDYDIIVGTKKENGKIEDLLLQSNTTVLLRVNTPTPIYLEYFSSFSSADMFTDELEGTGAYVLEVSKGKKVIDAQSIKLPETTPADNYSKIVSNVKFNADMSGLAVKRDLTYLGHLKESEQGDKLYFFDYVYEDNKKYGTQPIMDRITNKKEKAKIQPKFDAMISSYKDKQKERLKKAISDEFDFEIDDYSMNVVNTGRFGKKVPLTIEETFNIKNNLVKRAGENYIFEIGKMITGQIEINEKEKNRTNNIYMPFPRSFENEIIFEIPEGYTAVGLDKLNKNVENETGAFVSKATQEGSKIVIKTSKKYNHYYEPNANWSKMIAFLDAAYQFSQEKILLKKN